MKYTTLGGTGLIVSRLSLGAMTFGQGTVFPGYDSNIDQSAADRLVGLALDGGVNLFDTADTYISGQSEVTLGRSLAGRRQDVVISTKVGGRIGGSLLDAGLSYRHIVMGAEGSLRRLNTDWIDIYQLHVPDPLTSTEEVLRALEDLVRQGKVRYVGFSNFPAWQTALAIGEQRRRGYTVFSTAQMYYSLLGRDIEQECVPLYRHTGIGVLAWSPLASGFLSGKYTRDNPVPADGRRSRFNFPPIDIEKGYAVVEELKTIGRRLDATPAQVALAWLLTRPFITSILLGITKTEQLEDNMQALDVRLAAADVERLDLLTTPGAAYPGWMREAGLDPQVRNALAT